MKLYFKNSQGKEKLIAEPNGFGDLWSKINEYLDRIGFESYYTRIRDHNAEFNIDYGSHTEFFVVKEVSKPEDVMGKETAKKIQSYRKQQAIIQEED